jgi:hypothetical protein
VEQEELHQPVLSIGPEYLLKAINAQGPLVLEQGRRETAMFESDRIKYLFSFPMSNDGMLIKCVVLFRFLDSRRVARTLFTYLSLPSCFEVAISP